MEAITRRHKAIRKLLQERPGLHDHLLKYMRWFDRFSLDPIQFHYHHIILATLIYDFDWNENLKEVREKKLCDITLDDIRNIQNEEMLRYGFNNEKIFEFQEQGVQALSDDWDFEDMHKIFEDLNIPDH